MPSHAHSATEPQNLKPKFLQQMRQPSPSPAVPTPFSPGAASTLVEFINVVPPPLTAELIALRPYIFVARRIAEVVSWKSRWDESCLALAAWWMFCLLAEPVLKYCLPLAALCILAARHWTHSPTRPSTNHPSPAPITEQAFQSVLADLTAIHALLPSIAFPVNILPPGVLLRICLTLYPPYLLITHFVSLRVCLGIAGTFVIIHRASWARNARLSLYRSAYLRWSYYRLYSIASGIPLPPRITPRPPSYATATAVGDDAGDPSLHPSPSLRFLFTIYENQRWWMALDWTAALLPNERPSWCTSSQMVVLPPVAFTLPSSSTAYVSDGHGGRIRRTATWHWEEPEWRVVMKHEGHESAMRVERAPPRERDSNVGEDAGGTASRILRAARRRSNSGASSNANAESPERTRAGERQTEEPFLGSVEEEELGTDPDGWVYGDNKWECPSNKGGMGKYTRYRRWTRVAVLSETVEAVRPGDFGIIHGPIDPSNNHGSGITSPALSAISLSPSMFAELESATSFPEGEHETLGSKNDETARAQSPPPQEGTSSGSSNMRSLLRQRLRAAVDGVGN